MMFIHFLYLGISLLVAGLSYYFRFLSLSGSIATLILAEILIEIGGFNYIYPMLSFFILSSILSKISKRFFSLSSAVHEKGNRRDYMQVIANGGLPGLIVILGNIIKIDIYNLYLVSIAAAAADTWSTEIGIIFGRSPFRITKPWEKIQKGMSGGVSVSGFLGGMLGSLSIVIFSFVHNQKTWQIPFFIFLFGFIGTIIDSFLGATIQGVYECPGCKNKTERKKHCGQETILLQGSKLITNDTVNILSPFMSCILYIIVI